MRNEKKVKYSPQKARRLMRRRRQGKGGGIRGAIQPESKKEKRQKVNQWIPRSKVTE